MKRPSMLLAILMSAAYLCAQPFELSLEEAVRLAVANSPSLRDQNLEVAAALRNKENSWNLFLPGITANIEGGFYDELYYPSASGRLVQPLSSSLKMDLKLSLDTRTLYDLEKRRNDYDMSLLAAQEAQRAFIIAVEKDYFALVAAAMDIENSLRTLELDEESYRQSTVKFERGLESELTLLNAELKLQVSRTGLVNARAGYEKKATAFKRKLGLDPQLALDLSTPLVITELDTSRLDSLLKELGGRLDLEIKRRAIQAAATAVDRYHAGSRLPLVTLGSSLSFSLSDFSVPLDSFSLSAGLSFSADAWIPGSQKDLAYKALVEEEAQHSAEYDRLLTAAKEKVADLLVDLSLKINELRLTDAKLSLSERIVAQTKEAYDRGGVTLLSLIEAQNKVEDQKQALVSSQLAYLQLVLDIGYALGVDWRSLLGSAAP